MVKKLKSEESIFLAQELTKTIHQFKKFAKPHGSCHGLRQSEFFLLGTIKKLAGEDGSDVKVSDISSELQITKAAVTHMINSVEESGFVQRLPDKNDRRIVLIKITEKGSGVMESMKAEMFNSIKGLIEFIGEEDSKDLIRILSKAVEFYIDKKS